jgi:hypothetical protein
MRTPYPGCDRRTTGVDDADARLDSARDQALRMVRAARAAFPRMNSRTIRLVHRHFHCPSNSDIRTIMKGFADIEAAIPTLTMQCVPGSTAFCQASGFVRGQVTNGVLEVCPASFRADARAYRLAGTFIHAGAVTSGLVGHECLKRDPCYDDFTVPAGDMVVGNPYSYTWFAIELAGNDVGTPLTIPCAPHVVAGENVDVPPGAATDPTLIRPHTGFDTPPAGSVIVQVYEDIAGNRFIYRDGLPGSSQYMSGEHMRYYFPRSRTP